MLLLLLLTVLLSIAQAYPELKAVPNVGQMTVQGCKCRNSCGATVQIGNSLFDWCNTEDRCGIFGVTTGGYYDYCVYPEKNDFEQQTAKTKQQEIWSKVTANQRKASWQSQLALFVMSIQTVFLNQWEFMPNERKKLIHSVGYVAKVAFQPSREYPNTGYTGVFEGSDFGMIRCSPAADYDEGTGISPGCALKFFRSGRTAAHWFTMPSLEPQPLDEGFNFFEKDFTNHPVRPYDTKLLLLANKFSQATNCPCMNGLRDSASRFVNDTQAKYPFEIVLRPSGDVMFPREYHVEDELEGHFHAVGPSTHLFDVIAYATPIKRREDDGQNIGRITTTSNFVSSQYGDTQMHFRHEYMEDDFADHPEWLSDIDMLQQCGNEVVTTVRPNQLPAAKQACPFQASKEE